MSTPPIPQTTVSHSGMLSRSPGAKNLPSSPMMMPAMITPMMSTGDPFHLSGRPCSGIARALAPRPTAQARIGEHRIAEVRGPLAEHLKDPPAGPGTARLVQAWAQLGSWLKAVHLRAKSPAADEASRGLRRHDPTACEPERDAATHPNLTRHVRGSRWCPSGVPFGGGSYEISLA